MRSLPVLQTAPLLSPLSSFPFRLLGSVELTRAVTARFIASAVKISEAPWQESEDPTWAAVPAHFWEDMASELLADVCVLYEQIDAYFPLRSNGFPPIIVSAAPSPPSLLAWSGA